MNNKKLYNEIYKFLSQELMLPTNYRGFIQLVDVVQVICNEPSTSIGKAYEVVGKKYKVCSTCVSNNIGKVINIANATMEPELKKKYFGPSKITNGYIMPVAFMNEVVMHIRCKM